MYKLLAILLTLSLSSLVEAQSPRKPPAEDLARALQERYDRIRDFSADFVHTYEGGVLRQKAVERGTVLVKKPGRMRWTYTDPEEKVFVSDGETIYSYVPADKQVMVNRMPDEDQATTPVLFLVGRGNLVRDFTISYTDVEGMPGGTYALRLVPRQPESEYEWLILVVDAKTLQMRELITGDQQGGTSRFTFTNWRENIGLSDRQFTFRIPRGVDVITNGTVSP